MDNFYIYLSGGMSGLSWEEQVRWRNNIKEAIKFGDHDIEKKVTFFSPPDYYNFKSTQHKSEREVMEYDLYNLRKSDLVIVNFNDPNSLGTAMELILAKEYRIPVIGLNTKQNTIHPWLSECCTRICDNVVELIGHVVDFYLK